MQLGFSTGALAKGDFKKGLTMSKSLGLFAIEYSALRYDELHALIIFLIEHNERNFEYVSLHLPSRYTVYQEVQIVQWVHYLFKTKGPINLILHPDAIKDFSLWRPFKEHLCLENMDGRKNIGKTKQELKQIFKKLPDARLCFDIGHAREIDPSMTVARDIVEEYQKKIVQIHISEVGADYKHKHISQQAHKDFIKVLELVAPSCVYIIETPVKTIQDAENCVHEINLYSNLHLNSEAAAC